MRGAYDAGVSYYRDNQVTMYGSTFQSLTDGNMGFPPAELRADGKVYAINTDKWIITANAIEAYNAGERVAALEETFQQTENPELVYAVTDASDRVLLGLTADGRPYFPKNETYRVESNAEWLAVWLDMAGHVLFGVRADGSTYVAKSDFLGTLARIEKLLAESGVDGTDLKAAIAALEAEMKPLAETFNFISNEEWAHAVVDAEGRLLLGIKADTGEVVMPKQDTYKVVSNDEWLAAWLDAVGHVLFGVRADGSTYVAKSDFLGTLARIEKLLAESGVDGTDLKAAIAALEAEMKPLAETFNFISNEEWAHAVVDAEGRLLLGIKADTGEVVMPKQDTYKVVSNDEWLAAWLDAVGHVLFGVRADGTFYAAKHEFGGDDVEAEIEALNATLSTLQDTLTSLKAKVSELESSVGQLQQGGEALEMMLVTEDPEGRTEMTTDAEGRILSFRDQSGVKHEEKLALNEVYDREGKEMELVTKDGLTELDISELEGVSNHDTPNLLIPSEMQKTFNDGVNSFTPPNDGYEMSNRIACRAGDWFTRTGTATGMVVVTDENDKNGTRLLNSDGSTLDNTFQIPESMTWVRYIRMAADVSRAQTGDVVICRGKEAYIKDEVGDYITVDKLRVQRKNMPAELLYIKSEDGAKYYQLYVDSEGQIKAKEIDPEVIPESDYPENWISFSLTGDFSGYYDYELLMNDGFLIVLKSGGPVKIYSIPTSRSVEWGEFSHYLSSKGEERFVAPQKMTINKNTGITLFDKDFNIIEDNIGIGGEGMTGSIDNHDFIYIDDGHYIVYNYDERRMVNIPGYGEKQIIGVVINEIKKVNDSWKVLGTFRQTDYPELCTDAFGELGDVVDSHTNTISLDYDGNLIYNDRNWECWVKIRRTENEDGTVTLGSATKDYDEAVIGRVGGRHNSAYIDRKRVLEEDFAFTDVPGSLTEVSDDDWEEWQWFHCHDVKYWGMKNIGGHDYPTYTLFDNNYWTADGPASSAYNSLNKRNNSHTNPGNTNNTSRIVQITIDWENHLVKDYKVYQITDKYSREQSGATMYEEGRLSIAYSYSGEFGLWDFTTEETQVEEKVYTGAKQLFHGKYDSYGVCYRSNTYKKSV